MIYIVDDAADYRFLVQQVFTKFLQDCPVRLFADGADLMDSILSDSAEIPSKPQVIVLDIDMPRLNGFQTLVRLKQLPDWQPIPVVMMTNRDAYEYRQESYRLGASAFILKPIDLTALKDTMVRLCAGTLPM